jgi:hypothetical protein
MVEDASGRVNGMTLQRKRTLAFIRRNDVMAVGMKSGLVKALDNWWLGLADNRDLVELLLRVQCTQGLVTEDMRQWMNTATRGYVGCTLVAKSIKVGQRSKIMDNWIMANSKCRGCSNRQLVAADTGEQRGAAEEVEAVAAGNAGVLVGEAGGEA